jgi:hypothetical protein
MTTAVLTSGRRMMLLVTGLLALPFIVAFGLYWFEWRPAKLANHGELIQPPQALPEAGLTLVDGRSLQTAELRRKWTLVMIQTQALAPAHGLSERSAPDSPGAGGAEQGNGAFATCADGQQRCRICAPIRHWWTMQRSYPDLHDRRSRRRPMKPGEAWRTILAASGYRFYIIDPLGNVMMRYPQEPEMQGMLRDLERSAQVLMGRIGRRGK